MQFIHNAVVEEFGDPSFDHSLREDIQEIELQDMHSHHTEVMVDLEEEFPWATGMSGQQVPSVWESNLHSTQDQEADLVPEA